MNKIISSFLFEKKNNNIWYFIFLFFNCIFIIGILFNVHGIFDLFFYIPIILGFFIISCFYTFFSLYNLIRKNIIYRTYILISFIIFFPFIIMSQILPLISNSNIFPQLLWKDTVGKNKISNIALRWYTSKATQNTVMWGTNSENYTIIETQKTNIHIFSFDDLHENTTYWYKINNEEKRTFKIPDMKNISIGFFSDLHYGTYSKKNDEIKKQVFLETNIDALFLVGDTIDLGFLNYQWKWGLNEISCISSVVPTKYIVGNHDFLFNGKLHYDSYLSLSNKNTIKYYGKIVLGNVIIFYLHMEYDHYYYIGEQQIWFENELKKTTDHDFIIVCHHAPIIGSSDLYVNNSRIFIPKYGEYFTSLFNTYNVSLSISGHQHLTEYLIVNNTHYIIIGRSGNINSGDFIKYDHPETKWINTTIISHGIFNYQPNIQTFSILDHTSTIAYSFIF